MFPFRLGNANGDIQWRASYKAWGNVLRVECVQDEQASSPNKQLQALRFQGHYYDSETGLHYNRFRYYDPDIDRFISQDPIGLLGGNKLYQYAANPSGWVDPLIKRRVKKCSSSLPAQQDYSVRALSKLGKVCLKLVGSRLRFFRDQGKKARAGSNFQKSSECREAIDCD